MVIDWPYHGSGANCSTRSDYESVVDYYRNLSFCREEDRDNIMGEASYEFVTGHKRHKVDF
jgi:hypothetical protein